jgi:hypothetical protein
MDATVRPMYRQRLLDFGCYSVRQSKEAFVQQCPDALEHCIALVVSWHGN